jgi:processive 1,2-diacylglycerol beta-glucosyltransferase
MHREAVASHSTANVAFCSAAVGCGHTRASVAVHDALRARGQLGSAAFIEALEHAPAWFTRGYRDGYLRAVRHAPRLVGAIYDRSDVPRRDRRLLGPVLDRIEDAMLRRFREHALFRNVDAVVSTHFLTTAVLGRMRLRGALRCPLVTVVTDEHPHAVWLHRGCDLTCVASAAARESAIAGGIDPARVEVTGIPIDPRFAMADGAAVGGDPRPMVLVCGGGHGLGDMHLVVRSIAEADPDAVVVVVCGKNAALQASMDRLANDHRAAPGGRRAELRVLGYTNAMHQLMAAATIMVGKPGGLSTTEARAVGLPMVLLEPIPGQEERNAAMLVSVGAALAAGRPEATGRAVAALLADPARLASMRRAAAGSGRPRAAFDVASRVAALARGQMTGSWDGRLWAGAVFS